MARKHAEIAGAGDGFVVRDLGSTNGIFVDGQRVKEKRLEDGARLTIGSVEFRCAMAAVPRLGEVAYDESLLDDGLRSIVDMDALDRQRGKAAAKGDAAMVAPLREAAESLLGARDLDTVLARFLELVAHHFAAERGFVGLRDETTGEVVPRKTWAKHAGGDARIVISRQISKVAVDSHRALLVRDAVSDERFEGAKSIRQPQIRSAMCAPLLRDGRVSGLIYVDKQSSERPFTEESLQVLSILATLAAVAVEETKLRDAIEREQQMRARLSRYSSRAVVEAILHGGEGADVPGMRCEERQISVLFCDFAGFTAFSESLPAADVSRALNAAFERVCGAVFAEDGTLDKFMGDGVLIFFGAPTTQLDHADRAVRTAIRMQQLLTEPGDDGAPAIGLKMRIGINSGPAIVGDLGASKRRDYTVIGDTVNVASRLEHSVAAPGQIVIGPNTHAIIGARFQCTPLEPRPLKGIVRVVQPWLVHVPES